MGFVKFHFASFRDNGDTIGAISVVWKRWNAGKAELELTQSVHLREVEIYKVYLLAFWKVNRLCQRVIWNWQQ